ncbi:DUF4160 domain-containing protein [Rhizobium sp. KAs_5_22]|uniref:DUF4160 domain-containing protein n=1 Tax=Ciceribacter selenitireducens TaxID=448181 RepID=UPI000490EDE4|nr:DUF4160 domain-containing protein [Ciceribacter selenitireducens]PPJ45898.1 DUF4160 domain-containing protein [Rhizobium sp. KAs_5_22]
MPVILRIGSLKFFFYSNEGDPREQMHVHVRDSGSEAKIWIEPSVRLSASKGFDRRTLRIIMGHVANNRATIERAWHEHFGD